MQEDCTGASRERQGGGKSRRKEPSLAKYATLAKGDAKSKDPTRTEIGNPSETLPALRASEKPFFGRYTFGMPAVVSISTFTPGPSEATAKQARAGGAAGKVLTYTSSKAGFSDRSAR